MIKNFILSGPRHLKESLRLLQGSMGLFENEYKFQFAENARKYINYASDRTKRIQVLIYDLLEYLYLGRYKDQKETIDFNSILEEVKLNRGTFIKGLDAELIKSGNLPVIASCK